MSSKRVVVESPYAGDVKANVIYARRALRDALLRGEAPIASHLLHAQDGVLRDEVPDERALGINAGIAWIRVADHVAVYADRGITAGMQQAIDLAEACGVPIRLRYIDVTPTDEQVSA